MQAAVTTGSADEKHVDRISWLSAVSTIGMAGGPVVGGLVAMFVAGDIQQFHATLWFAVVLTLAALFCLACISIKDGGSRSKPNGTARSLRSAFRPNLRLPLALTITTSFGQGVILSVTALMVYVRFGWGVAQTGLVMGMVAGAMAVTRMFLLPRLAKRLGLEWCLLVCISMAIPGLIGLAVTHDRILFCAFTALVSCANGMGMVLPTMMVSIRAEKHERGYILGVNQGAMAIAVSLSASGNGFLFDFVAPGAPHLLGALIMSIGFVMLAVALARQRYPRDEAVA
jgi:predicted MFS family arabinose efflux permease